MPTSLGSSNKSPTQNKHLKCSKTQELSFNMHENILIVNKNRRTQHWIFYFSRLASTGYANAAAFSSQLKLWLLACPGRGCGPAAKPQEFGSNGKIQVTSRTLTVFPFAPLPCRKQGSIVTTVPCLFIPAAAILGRQRRGPGRSETTIPKYFRFRLQSFVVERQSWNQLPVPSDTDVPIYLFTLFFF